MTIDDLREKMKALKATGVAIDTMRVELESDGVSLKSAELFVGKQRHFSHPKNYKSNLMEQEEAARKHISFSKPTHDHSLDWRLAPVGQEVYVMGKNTVQAF